MKKGSVTVFLALVLVLVLSFACSLLESGRVYCMKAKAQMATDLCLQSLFGNYHQGIWEDYHLLFIDGTWQGEEFSMEQFAVKAMEELEGHLAFSGKIGGKNYWNLTKLEAISFDGESYELATDDEGRAFRTQVSRQMGLEAAEDALHDLLGIQELPKDVKEKTEDTKDQWETAWEAIDTAEEKREQETDVSGEDGTDAEGMEDPLKDIEDISKDAEDPLKNTENPMEYVKKIRTSAVLGLVLEDVSQVSAKAVSFNSLLKDKQLLSGNLQTERGNALTERLWMQYYIQQFFSNYVEKGAKGPEQRVLDYEMEYIIGGKPSDRENLEMVVYELLGVREALNFATILKDEKKKGLALEIATAAVGFTGLLPLVKAVQVGILIAWAFVESVVDIRSLLGGKKIPFLKRSDQWASSLTDSKKVIEDGQKAQENMEGLDYTQYLQILLFLLSEKSLHYRCMDLIGQNEQVRMDTMIQSVKGTGEYQGSPMFWRWNLIGPQKLGGYFFGSSKVMTYGKE